MAGLRIGICGGGVDGLCAGIALRRRGNDVSTFEQAAHFGRVGADINLTPNAVHALDGLGVGAGARRSAAAAEKRARSVAATRRAFCAQAATLS